MYLLKYLIKFKITYYTKHNNYSVIVILYTKLVDIHLYDYASVKIQKQCYILNIKYYIIKINFFSRLLG